MMADEPRAPTRPANAGFPLDAPNSTLLPIGSSSSAAEDASVPDDGGMARPADPYQGDDFYCDVALPDPAALEVVHDGDAVLAFHHTRPFWPVHIVVVPKRHVPSLTETEGADDDLARELLAVVQEVADRVVTTHGAARVLTNLGSYQDSKHLHIHVSSGEPLR
jgi:histidine triad (HIT) family protein